MNVFYWHVGTGTFEGCYLGFNEYASACNMLSCVIYLSGHHNFVLMHAQNPVKQYANMPVPEIQRGTLI